MPPLVLNHTPHRDLHFERRDPEDRPLLVSVVVATYRIEAGALVAIEEAPLPLGPLHRGAPERTSLRHEGVLATFKPRADVHLDAVARAPGGRPRSEWPVRIQVGSLTKDLVARGPHAWAHRHGRWALERPAPTLEVPLIHEHAFGGTVAVDGELVREPRNPLGTGFLPRGGPTREPVAAPQVVAIDEPEHRPGHRYEPQGVNPRGPSFAPRVAHAGTYDAAWERDRWPRLPADFDYAFYNSAHPDLIYPSYLSGDETVALVGLAREGAVRFRLPAERVWIRVSRGRVVRPIGARLDTLHIDATSPDPNRWRVQLVWRACSRLDEPLTRVDVRATGSPDGGT